MAWFVKHDLDLWMCHGILCVDYYGLSIGILVFNIKRSRVLVCRKQASTSLLGLNGLQVSCGVSRCVGNFCSQPASAIFAPHAVIGQMVPINYFITSSFWNELLASDFMRTSSTIEVHCYLNKVTAGEHTELYSQKYSMEDNCCTLHLCISAFIYRHCVRGINKTMWFCDKSFAYKNFYVHRI